MGDFLITENFEERTLFLSFGSLTIYIQIRLCLMNKFMFIQHSFKMVKKMCNYCFYILREKLRLERTIELT